MSFFAALRRTPVPAVPLEPSAPEPHTAHSSPVDPDTPPKPTPAPPAPSRAPEPPGPVRTWLTAELTDADVARENRVLDRLATLTTDPRVDSLTAARTLFAPDLLTD